MKKIVHNENLIEFEFLEVLDRVSYTTSAFLWIDNGKGVLIDAGYYEYALKIKIAIEEMSISLEYVIVTHYHRDHAEGSVLFDQSNIVASKKYEVNLNKCQNLSQNLSQNLMKQNLDYPVPNVLIDNYLTIEFENTNLYIFSTPGHTPCSISVLIDESYLFVSDLLLEDIDGKMIIPYIDLNSNPVNHLKSLRKYEILNANHLMLTHGSSKFNCDVSYELIDRIFYLEKFIDLDYKPELESCLMRPLNQYAMTEIHKLNIRNAKKINLKR